MGSNTSLVPVKFSLILTIVDCSGRWEYVILNSELFQYARVYHVNVDINRLALFTRVLTQAALNLDRVVARGAGILINCAQSIRESI